MCCPDRLSNAQSVARYGKSRLTVVVLRLCVISSARPLQHRPRAWWPWDTPPRILSAYPTHPTRLIWLRRDRPTWYKSISKTQFLEYIPTDLTAPYSTGTHWQEHKV